VVIIPLTNPRLYLILSNRKAPHDGRARTENGMEMRAQEQLDHYHRYFICHGCWARIDIPLPIPLQTLPTQIPWPAGATEQNFLCFVCRQAMAYGREEFLANLNPSTSDSDICDSAAVFQFSLPCGIDNCAGLVEIHAVMSKDSSIADAVGFATKISAVAITCNRGIHTHSGPCVSASSVGFALDKEWTAA